MKTDKTDLLLFAVAGRTYSAPVDSIREVIMPEEIIPVAETAHAVEGVMHVRDEVVTIVSLSKIIAPENQKKISSKAVILMNTDRSTIGVAVDRVLRVISINSKEIKQPDPSLRDAYYLLGVFDLDGTLILHIDLSRIEDYTLSIS